MKRKKYLYIGVIIGSVLGALVLGLRYALPPFLSNKYESQINQYSQKVFDKELYDNMRKLGLEVAVPEPAQCDNGPFSGTAPCRLSSFSGDITFTDSMKIALKDHAKEFDSYLLEHGWKLVSYGPGVSQTILYGTYESMSEFNYDRDFEATYSVENNGVRCIISTSFISSYNRNGPVFASIGCSKSSRSPLNIFRR
jgi:hypothetical protein